MEQENKLYIGNLPYSVTDASLAETFAVVGEVIEAVVIKDRDSGRSKGFGFVTMATPELAQQAISQLHESEVDGRQIVVNVARPREE
ncbi:RNA-binding protein [bacterium]|uniref:RNA-binding protein n=2 Tax=Katanobacteria TaxID=422282 RepID=A0A2M7X332_UNCKA|nr:RNA-binding protein [bacterium]PIP56486.1 MAG: RNA-binding protein [candidate division WWE3 bacterium CG22_combo_CG10-13_8_21_14_all_39_12]PJA40529.1 MAG: RNA-binding protein [candidate division WWE3 bacterium CG_4_9_14_3_um_filter_39_7]